MARKAPGNQVNRSGLAGTFGVSLPTIDNWVSKGAPVVSKGGRGVEWVFDTAEIARWLRDQALADAGSDNIELDDIEKRTKRARMLEAELSLAVARKEVAPIREFERASAAMDAAVRANVMNVPARAVLQLLGETDETRFKKVLRAELTLALETAAATDLSADEPDDEDDE